MSQSLEEEWRGTESMLLEVQFEVSTVSDDLGCHVISWCWSTVFSDVHSQRSHLPSNSTIYQDISYYIDSLHIEQNISRLYFLNV